MWRLVSHFHGRYNSACLHLLRGNHAANHFGKSLNTPPIILRQFGPKNTQKTDPKNPEIATIPCRSRLPHSHLHARPMTHARIAHREREMWWEREAVMERERRWETEKRHHGGRERESDMWIKKYHFVLELCYSAILKVELHCSTIAKKFAIVEFYNSGWSMVFVWKW